MIKRISDKKGSHIEMVLSFVVFVTFIVFLYLIISPSINKQKDKDYLLSYTEDNIINKIATDFDYYSLTIKETEYDKFLLDMPNFSNENEKYRIIIKTDEYNPINFELYSKPGDTDNNRWMIDTSDYPEIRYFKIYYSLSLPQETPDLKEDKTGYQKLNANDYYFQFIRREKLIYENEISLKIDCAEYDNLKTEFNIPEGREFAFQFEKIDGTLVHNCNLEGKNAIEEQTNIYSEQIPILFFNSNAEINSGFLMIYIW